EDRHHRSGACRGRGPGAGERRVRPPASRAALVDVISSVLVEAFAALLAELPRPHHAPQDLRRTETLAELREQVIGDGEADVEADVVGELQGTHRVPVAELDGPIDLL